MRADDLDEALAWYGEVLGFRSLQTWTFGELAARGVPILAEPFDLPEIGRRLALFADPWGNVFELAQRIDPPPAG